MRFGSTSHNSVQAMASAVGSPDSRSNRRFRSSRSAKHDPNASLSRKACPGGPIRASTSTMPTARAAHAVHFAQCTLQGYRQSSISAHMGGKPGRLGHGGGGAECHQKQRCDNQQRRAEVPIQRPVCVRGAGERGRSHGLRIDLEPLRRCRDRPSPIDNSSPHPRLAVVLLPAQQIPITITLLTDLPMELTETREQRTPAERIHG